LVLKNFLSLAKKLIEISRKLCKENQDCEIHITAEKKHNHTHEIPQKFGLVCETNNWNYYIPHKWIVLFAHADWLARRWLAKYYSPASSRRKTKWLPVSNKVTLKQVKLLFGPLVIQLVWYILKQLFTSVLVKVVDIHLATLRLYKYPPLFTSTSVNNC